MTKPDKHNIEHAGFVNSRVIAELFGYRQETIIRMFTDGRLPAVKLGNRWLMRKEDLQKLLQELDAATTK